LKQSFDVEALIETWRGPLTGLIAGQGVSWPEAREIAREVFAQAWLGRARFRGNADDERAVGAWLAGIARNLVRESSRRASKRAQGLHDTLEPAVECSCNEQDELATRVRAAIDDLPEREREVVQAFYLEETSTVHVAALVGISPRAVEGLLRRARARLQRSLVQQDATP